MKRVPERLINLIEPVVVGLGYELVGIEFNARQKILRVYIDADGGIVLDDCSRVSHQLSAALDVEDPIPGHYQLEVSSPGLDRPLFNLDHFDRFKDHWARIQLSQPLDQRKNFKGKLLGVKGSFVLLQDEMGQVLEIPFEIIDKARLIPDYQTARKGS